ncbi:electron transfer flavoprotein alpha-subunit [Coprinopsis cinerea okayama7|uniref:Probable electron transfer flavoprotein subunit alpha n=1 Tax=Coprinopsis cinerea (strain Okayama-7 / 130 / ATCC MYA-4618 / FGSC 9003) TaxID=240176 RepID=A8N690_COPC7|nr:electron transfer flavoprotein alpha-subunit [Coprinopsis cinerea okayama7\|eukprot:XP_001830363.1 electron transfer flavoprotein alpha-subunit [Coprinopsis cinerea okayama7\
MMLRTTARVWRRACTRSYATVTQPHALVFLEQRQGVLEPGSLSAVTAAGQLGGQVSALIVGDKAHVASAVEEAKKLKGVNNILHSAAPEYAEPVTETLSPLLKTLISSSAFTHVVSATSSSGKSLLPRVSAQFDAPTVSDVTTVAHDASTNSTTFTRPIYAGNAIATVEAPASIPVKFFTVRGTAFAPATSDGSSNPGVETVNPVPGEGVSEHLKTIVVKSDRPDLGVATRVVSGGRALKDAKTFEETMYPLADVLGAAVGASRAAVDAGYADNSLQVGQTGKVVAPQLYMALGISGAIQHLAGMKDSKLIVAINKDPDAPIFQVADVGLVGDLFEAVPKLIEELKKD